VSSRELDGRIGEIYLAAGEIGTRVRELAAEVARDYAGREPLLVGTLKACIPFIADLSMAMPIAHHLDFVALAGYGHAQLGGHPGIRFLKDLWICTIAEMSVAWNQPARLATVSRSKAPCSWSIMQ